MHQESLLLESAGEGRGGVDLVVGLHAGDDEAHGHVQQRAYAETCQNRYRQIPGTPTQFSHPGLINHAPRERMNMQSTIYRMQDYSLNDVWCSGVRTSWGF
jgi:hypothetical protein